MKVKSLISMVSLLFIIIIASCKKDDKNTVSPTVSSTNPQSNAIKVPTNTKISSIFSVSMDSSTITKTNFTVLNGTTVINGTIAYVGNTATFAPENDLLPNTTYQIKLSADIRDKSGTSLNKDYSWSFTTGETLDIILPTVTLTDPLNNAADVVRNKVISITYSEAMDPATINGTVITLKQGSNSIDGIVNYSGNIATFTPSVSLLAGTIYTVTISAGSKDLAGNILANPIIYNFTTKSAGITLEAVKLGAAGNYVILAKTAISNISTSVVTGNLGLSPAATSYVTGFSLTNATGYATSAQITGKIYAADMADPTPINLTTAINNMLTAYTDAAGRPLPDFMELGTGNIGGKTLTPGLYKWTSNVTLSSDVTISGGANDVWIFQIAGNLGMSSAVKIKLTGGAQAKNVFWQVAGQVSLGTTSHIEGIILSQSGISFLTGSSINGRALAQTAVTLDGTTVSIP